MITPSTGRPRGRPRKPRPPRHPRVGRPRLDFCNDPDRYAIALLDAMLALEMAGSERACALAVATWVVGLEAQPPQGSPPGLTTWVRRRKASRPRLDTRAGTTAGTLDGKAATLRIKQRRCRSVTEAGWRKAMASAFMLVFGARDQEVVKPIILQRAAAVGEGGFAKRVVWSMVDAKFSLLEFSTNSVSTAEAV